MRKLRKKFKKPMVSWESESIKENKVIMSEYGLRRRKEILISHENLRGFRERARQLIAESDENKEKLLMDKLSKLGLLKKGSSLDDVLALTVRDILDRRLQTIVFNKGAASSPLNARQLIVHGHVKIDGRKIKFPSYIVNVDEEGKIDVDAKQQAAKPKTAKKTEKPAEAEKPAEPKNKAQAKEAKTEKKDKDAAGDAEAKEKPAEEKPENKKE